LRIFISSVYWGLEDLRERIWAWAAGAGHEAWIFEKLDLGLEGAPPPLIQKVCLDEVAASDLYVGLFHQGYGSSAGFHLANVSLVDLELFEAFRLGKPIRIYVLEPFEPAPELRSLLAIVSALAPGAVVPCRKEDLVERLARDVPRRIRQERGLPSFRRFLDVLGIRRRPLDEWKGVRFLAEGYPRPAGRSFDREWVQERLGHIAERKKESSTATLATTWEVFQGLFEVPWREARYREHLPLWDEALQLWDGASAWAGLHGPIFLGKLAADRTLLAVRSLLAAQGEQMGLEELLAHRASRIGVKEEWLRLYSSSGAIANAYYSIGKSLSAPAARRYYLGRAEDWLRVAERASEIEPDPVREAGSAAIHGHIRLRLADTDGAVTHFERSLRLRLEYGEGPASIAEARSDLGYAFSRAGRTREAEALLRSGVDTLERSHEARFAIRAKWKLAEFLVRRGSFHESARQIAEAGALCRRYGIHDQAKASLPRRLFTWGAAALWPELRRLCVAEIPDGYKYKSRDDDAEDPPGDG